MRYQDIPQFTRPGSWECDFSPKELLAYVDTLVARDGLDINPDFQRGHVWNAAQRSAYVEFILRGGQTGKVVYLNWPSLVDDPPPGAYNDFVLVDGKQRLEAWRRFYANEVSAFGLLARQFTGHVRGHCGMRLNINTLRTRHEVLQWYVDFNSGGVVHSEEEIDRVRRMLAEEQRLTGKP